MTGRGHDDHAARRHRRRASCASAVCLVLVSAAPSLAHRCVGDCDTSDTVSVAELILGVRIALEQASISSCPSYDADFDRRVSIDELLVAVNNAFSNCGHGTATPTANEALPLATDTDRPLL